MARCFSCSQKLLILRKSGYRCALCQVELTAKNFTADHIIPYTKGGKTEAWNGQALCASCNMRKSDKIN